LNTIAIALKHIMGPTIFNNAYEAIFKGFVQIVVGSNIRLLVAKFEKLKEWTRRGYAPVTQDDSN